MSAVEVLDLRVPMRDGIELSADVVRPAGVERLPVLLIRTPYSRGAMRLLHDVVGLARSGWAVVVQDVRGRFDSAGTFTPFSQEVEDGYDTVDWCSRQGWSDGRVVMTGWSYAGATQWLAARFGHPALRAINPIVGAGDIDTAMLHVGGAFQIGLVQPWVLGLAASDPAATDEHRIAAGALGERWAEVMAAAPGADPVADLLPGYAAWRRGETAAPGDISVDVPVFQVAGWYDIFCESALRHWQAQADRGVAQRLVIGPWSHSNGLSNLHPERDFGGAANGAYVGVLGQALHWVRQVLDGVAVPSGISCFVMGEGWRELAAWPPPSDPLVLHLGTASMQAWPQPGALPVALQHDPSDPVRTMGGRVLGPFLPLPGPVDQRPVEKRADVAVFSAEVQNEPLTVIGQVTARIAISTDAKSADVAVKLCDVFPDGRVFNVVEGIRRVDLVPGEVTTVVVEVGSTAYHWPVGHRLRLHVAGSSFPRFDVNPGTGEPPGTALAGRRATHLLHPAQCSVSLPRTS